MPCEHLADDLSCIRPLYCCCNGWMSWVTPEIMDSGDPERIAQYCKEQDDKQEEYDCPIHGKCEGGECPRC